MNTETFKKEVYGPYKDAWTILKIIQEAGETPEPDKRFDEYMDAVDEFEKKYKGNLFAEKVRMFLLSADNAIAEMNKGGSNAVQKAKEKE